MKNTKVKLRTDKYSVLLALLSKIRVEVENLQRNESLLTIDELWEKLRGVKACPKSPASLSRLLKRKGVYPRVRGGRGSGKNDLWHMNDARNGLRTYTKREERVRDEVETLADD